MKIFIVFTTGITYRTVTNLSHMDTPVVRKLFGALQEYFLIIITEK